MRIVYIPGDEKSPALNVELNINAAHFVTTQVCEYSVEWVSNDLTFTCLSYNLRLPCTTMDACICSASGTGTETPL